jgi:hypothetical protein
VHELALYAQEPSAGTGRGGRRLSVYLGLAVLLAAASLVAVNGRGGAPSRFPRVVVPGSGGLCTSPPNGALFTQAVDGMQIKVCISQQGNINQISYPDNASGHTQIAFDGYCLAESVSGSFVEYKDYSPGAGVASSGFGPATLTQTAPEIFNMTRDTTDGKFRLTEFIKVNLQPRSVFVAMTVKNIDPANVTHNLFAFREVAPAIDGNAADDQYNQFGGTGSLAARTGQAYQDPGPGTNSLLFGPTQASGVLLHGTVADFQDGGGCADYNVDTPGHVAGGNRVFVGFINNGPAIPIAPNASVNVGKFVYRMV